MWIEVDNMPGRGLGMRACWSMPQGIEVFREAPLAVVKAVAVPANKADPEEEDMPWLHTAARLAFERLPTQSQHIWMSLADAFSRPPKKSPGEYTPSHRHSASSHDTVPASSLTPQATFYAAMPSQTARPATKPSMASSPAPTTHVCQIWR